MIAAVDSSAAKMARKKAAVDEFLKQRDVPRCDHTINFNTGSDSA